MVELGNISPDLPVVLSEYGLNVVYLASCLLRRLLLVADDNERLPEHGTEADADLKALVSGDLLVFAENLVGILGPKILLTFVFTAVQDFDGERFVGVYDVFADFLSL